MLNIVLFGPPGAGKGTQAQLLSKQYSLYHLSTGYALRHEIEAGTDLGLQAKQYMDRGELVPDKDVTSIVVCLMDKHPGVNGFIFDGFPRTVNQAQFLREMLQERNTEIRHLIVLDVGEEELIQRLLKRAEIEKREDDTREVIENRIRVYRKQTAPVIDYYTQFGKYHPVSGIGSIEEVQQRINKIISPKQ
jgi:adenylate kinase